MGNWQIIFNQQEGYTSFCECMILGSHNLFNQYTHCDPDLVYVLIHAKNSIIASNHWFLIN